MIKLDVPTLAQELDMCCWHTSAMMIWQYWQKVSGRQGPMNTVAPVYTANTGLPATAQSFIVLARKVGLLDVALKNTHSTQDLERYLGKYGPIWCAGTWYGFGHVIVLTGVEGGTVYLNDPDGGVKKEGRLDWFNKELMNGLAGCMMYKDPAAY